jgi:ubiquitin fusion degradation protein 1
MICRKYLATIIIWKGKRIKLQPHETAFIDLSDPRAVLENSLRNYICLTEGETIKINFAGKSFMIDIKNVEPKS